jgi:hypothetical protein
MIRRVCCMCRSEMGSPLEPDVSEVRTSHGICRNCLDEYMAGTDKTMDDFLDSVPAPVFVVDGSGRVVTANTLAQETVSKDLAQIKGRLGGEVFRCHYASLPGGCGETLHCQSCVIRNTVMMTFETGKPCIRVPACQDLDTIEGPRRIRFLISTEKAGDAVLLLIDDAQPDESTVPSKAAPSAPSDAR